MFELIRQDEELKLAKTMKIDPWNEPQCMMKSTIASGLNLIISGSDVNTKMTFLFIIIKSKHNNVCFSRVCMCGTTKDVSEPLEESISKAQSVS